jgi:hypothetical protein
MRNGRRSKVWWLAALLPLLAASVLPTQSRTLVCRFTGAIMQRETCCPAELDEKTPPTSELVGEDCCLVKTVDLPRLLTDSSPDGTMPVQERSLAVAQTSDDMMFVKRWAHCRPLRPPPLGPPIILLKRSFLI